MGIPLGTVQKQQKSKGLLTLKIKHPISIGDTISLERETGSYTISELMINNDNIRNAPKDSLVTIGRMRGNISLGDKVFKISSKELITKALSSINEENKFIKLTCTIKIYRNKPIYINTKIINNKIFSDLSISYTSSIIPSIAKNKPISKEIVEKQFRKTSNTNFVFKTFFIEIDDNLFVPTGQLNELRRTVLNLIEIKLHDYIKRNKNFKVCKGTNNLDKINIINNSYKTSYIKKKINTNVNSLKKSILKTMSGFQKNAKDIDLNTILNKKFSIASKNHSKTFPKIQKPKLSVLLNKLNKDFTYSKLKGIDNIYIPISYFLGKKYEEVLLNINMNFNLYIYIPPIIKDNFNNLFKDTIEKILKLYHIKGFIISNLSQILWLKNLNYPDLEIIANTNLNLYNLESIKLVNSLGINNFTLPYELNKQELLDLINTIKKAFYKNSLRNTHKTHTTDFIRTE